YTTDPEWIPLTDQFPSLSIGALALSPMDPTHNTLFAGIGRTSNLAGLQLDYPLTGSPQTTVSRLGGPLTGILRTTDGGTTWQQLGTDLTGLNIESVVPTTLGGDPAHHVVLVAADGG